jgi:hypothetical protein
MSEYSALDSDKLSPVGLSKGDVFESLLGERIEIVEDDIRSDKPLLVRYPERDGDQNTARMSRYSFADAANYEGYERIERGQTNDEDSDEHLDGTFDGPVPCPSCGTFMRTGYDGMGLPAAGCVRVKCNRFLDDHQLRSRGFWEKI